jgi:hypothetical protein
MTHTFHKLLLKWAEHCGGRWYHFPVRGSEILWICDKLELLISGGLCGSIVSIAIMSCFISPNLFLLPIQLTLFILLFLFFAWRKPHHFKRLSKIFGKDRLIMYQAAGHQRYQHEYKDSLITEKPFVNPGEKYLTDEYVFAVSPIGLLLAIGMTFEWQIENESFKSAVWEFTTTEVEKRIKGTDKSFEEGLEEYVEEE